MTNHYNTFRQLLLTEIGKFHTPTNAVRYGRLRPRCHHLVNSTKYMCCLWFWPMCSIVRKH